MLLLILRPPVHSRRYKPTGQARRCIVLESNVSPSPFLKGRSNWTRSSVLPTACWVAPITTSATTQASRKNFAKAFELKDRRLTQEENFQTTAFYHLAITGNLEKETAVLVLYKQAYPRSAFAHSLLGIDYALQGRIEEALQEFYWAIDDSPIPSASLYCNASQALMILGRFDEAKKLLDQWWQKGSLHAIQATCGTNSPFSRTTPQLWDGLPVKPQRMMRVGSAYKCGSHSFTVTSANFVLSAKRW